MAHDAKTMDEPEGTGGLLLRFVNTRPLLHPGDYLADAQAAKAWFVEEGLMGADELVSEADASAARELRTALVTLLKSHVGAADLDELEFAGLTLKRAAMAHPLAPVIDSRGAVLTGTQKGVAGALGSVLGDVATTALDERRWTRFKACKNPTCFRGFRDNSRPGSAMYCSHSCSSQVSMRTMRQRNKSEHAAQS